jgi:hypothetical protein
MKLEVSLMISLKRSSLHYTSSEVGSLSRGCGTYLGGVHLVDGNDELPNTEGESKQSVLSGLAVLGDTSFEFTSARGNDEDSAICLRSTSDHVLDEITVSGGVNDLGSP